MAIAEELANGVLDAAEALAASPDDAALLSDLQAKVEERRRPRFHADASAVVYWNGTNEVPYLEARGSAAALELAEQLNLRLDAGWIPGKAA